METYRRLYLYILLVMTIRVSVFASQASICTFVGKTTFEKCGSRDVELESFRKSKENRVERDVSISTDSLSKDGCINNGSCRRVIKIARIRQQSFSAKTLVHISEMLRRCCGNCTKYHLSDIWTPIYNVNQSTLDKFDIIYPVPAQALLDETYGRYFIPVYNVPNAYYFTLRRSEREMAINMVRGCLMMWPLLVICLLMALIAGFFGWILDTWSNEQEFPRPFINGLLEGFWWSFVSMTTVGYGDKSPKSLPARFFAMLWILIGITLTSIYVASLTTEIMSYSESGSPELTGMQVGALKDRLHDALMISQHGGILNEVEFETTISGIAELIRKLDRKEIDGFLVSKSTYFYYSRVIKDVVKYRELGKSVDHVKMLLTEKSFLEEKMMTGMLMKDRQDYDYFKKYFESNWLQIQGCYSYDLNYKEKKFVEDTNNAISGLFFPFLGISLGMLGIIFCIGFVYEMRRRKMLKLKVRKMLATDEDNFHETKMVE